MGGVLVAVGTKLFQFHPGGGVPTIFLRRIARDARRPFSRIAPALRTLKRNDNANVLTLGHSSTV